MLGEKVFLRSNGLKANIIDLYHGQDVFLICNGPSFKDVDKSLLKLPGIVTMTVNNGGHSFRSNLWTGQDPQDKFMQSIWEDPNMMKFTLLQYRFRHYYDHIKNRVSDRTVSDCPNVIFHKRHSNFIPEDWLNEKEIVWGRPKKSGGNRSVMLAAIHILYLLGFKNIYLLGVDFNMSSDKKYFFPENRGPAAIRNNNKLFKNISSYLKQIKPKLEEKGVHIYNCNPGSKLDVFDFADLNDAIEINTIDLSASTVGMYERGKK
jgi:hypothetical protein